MKIKALIKKHLDKEYKISVDKNSFIIIDKNSGDKVSEIMFIDSFKNIFGDHDQYICLANDWFAKNVYKLDKQILNFIKKQDIKLGSKLIESKIVKHFKRKNLNETFICDYFNLYYRNNVMQKWVNDYLERIDYNKFSGEIVSEAKKELKNENLVQTSFVLKKINVWYNDNMLMKRLDEFFTKAHVFLGRFTWEIAYSYETHVKTVEMDNILMFFSNEDEFHRPVISRKVNAWLENKIIEINEKIMPS